MSSRFQILVYAALVSASACWPLSAMAQQDDVDPEMRIDRLEEQLRTLTGQNEELQYRNRQLEEQLRQLGGNAAPAPGQQPAPQSNVAAAPPAPTSPGYNYGQQPGYSQAQPGYGQPQG